MGVVLVPSNTENKCSTNRFDNNSFPESFRCSPCQVYKNLLLAGSIILTWLQIFASFCNLLFRALIILLICESFVMSYLWGTPKISSCSKITSLNINCN